MHLLHDISPGKKAPEIVNAIIEIPKGDRNKYELDKEYGIIKVDRVLHSSFVYPANYGFIPQTLAGDGDPLDILVLGQMPVHPGSLMQARPIGVMKMMDEGKKDNKIIAVHANDPDFRDIMHTRKLPPSLLNGIKHFFKTYKELEHKEVLVKSFSPPTEAKRIILKTIARYKEEALIRTVHLEGIVT